LIVEGHTDSDGDDEANQALSELRAGMIKDYLINNYEEITPDMVDAQGYGKTRPIVTNDTPENKALNRRIEIVVWE
jgi:outer membrane protein OmpA-like peptidoglycan-associated protein